MLDNFIKRVKDLEKGIGLYFKKRMDDMLSRHNELVNEMVHRGMNHRSPFEAIDVEYLFNGEPYSYGCRIDLEHNLRDLSNRCPLCSERIKQGELK